MRRIAVVTGHRGEYSIFRSVLRAIERRADLEYSLIVTGLHLAPEYGLTIDEIKKDGFRIDETVDMLINSDTGAAMAKSMGLGLLGITQALERILPDIILVLGDRLEPLAAAIAGACMNIAVSHMHGGEVSGTLDESIRHAITKFSHIHFAATKKSYERIVKLGENPEYVFLTGAAGLDEIINGRFLSKKEVFKKLGFNINEQLLLAVQHPVTSEIDIAEDNIICTLKALIALGLQTVLIYSNSDAGNKAMMRRMSEMIDKADAGKRIKVFKNLPRSFYLSVMKHANCMVGNSSGGIIEAPSLGLPVVNIGTRQDGRERAGNVIDVPYKNTTIVSAIKKAIIDKDFIASVKMCQNPYDPFGDGKAGERIADILSRVRLGRRLTQKKIAY